MLRKLSLVACMAFAFNTYGQTIVSTTPENKNVILEEFTGIHCGFCPAGHAISQNIQDNNPGDVYLIYIHSGGFATPGAGEPDFRVPDGAAIDTQANVAGYPAGTVNRHVFPAASQNPGGTAMGRNEWASAAAQTLTQSSYVNVAVEATIDVQTSELTVHVEGYYTGDSPETTNLLNVALLQNNTKGPQTSGGQGNNYNHMHRLVDFITGQWGQSIPTTTTGTFVDETFTYTIPADYNGIPTKLVDMEVVAFISETHQEIISGSGVHPTLTNIANANDVSISSIDDIPETCATTVNPVVTIKNTGANPLTSLNIQYSVNSGTPATYTWTGNLTSFQDETIDLPGITYTSQATNTIDVTLPADDDTANNTASITFDEAPQSTGTVYLSLTTDDYGQEAYWIVKDFSGAVLYSEGAFTYGANETANVTLELPADCITFTLYDSYGDGGTSATLTDYNGNVIFQTNGSFSDQVSQQFSSDGILGTHDATVQNIAIYPNPASSNLYVKNADNASIDIYNILGQKVISKSTISADESIDVSKFQTGTYFIKITTESSSKTEKFLIEK